MTRIPEAGKALGSLSDAIRRRCAKCPNPKGCASCVFGDYLLSPDPEGRKAAQGELERVAGGRRAAAGGSA